MRSIPFVKPFIGGREAEYVADVLRTGKLDSDGEYTRGCARFLEQRLGAQKVLMTPSCTSALEIAAILCDLAPGDEVILPSYTFVSTANAVVLRGARPVFVDIRPDTLNIDERLIERAINPRTRAIFVVHYAGVACEMDAIMSIADQHGLIVVEDAAQAVNSAYRGRPLGSIGHLGTLSFHVTKNYVAGEGGALCVNSPTLLDRAEIIREKGTDRSQFFRGQVDKYTWVDIGGSHLPSELSCAFLLAQLEQLDAIGTRRREICEFYRRQLEPFARDGMLELPTVPGHCLSNDHMFYLLLPDSVQRDALIAHLKSQDICAVFHYIPLHTSPMGERFGYRPGDLPLTESLSGRVLRLPLYCDLTHEDLQHIVEQVAAFCQAATVRQPDSIRTSSQSILTQPDSATARVAAGD